MKAILQKRSKSVFTSFLKFFLTFVFLLSFVSLQSQTIKQYAAEEVTQLMADMTAGKYDIYELTSSGATYVLTSTGLTPVAATKSFTLRAAEFLTEKPVLQFSANTTSTTRYMFYPSATITATFKGIKVNGYNPQGGAGNLGQPNFFRTHTTSVNTNIVIRDCDFYNFAQTSGLFRIDGAGTSLDIQGSTFKNCVGNIINFQTASINYGALTVKNCTFSDMTGATAMISYGNGSTGTNVLIDHCTMANFNTSREIFIFRTLSSLQIKNSLFSSIYGGFNFSNPVPTIDSCYLDGFATAPTGNITNSFTGTAPVFENPSTQNYKLTNKTSFICGDGLPVGNTMYYVETPEYVETMQQYAVEDVEQLKADMIAGTYDIYELTTSGGEYVVLGANNYGLYSPKSFTLRAAQGLEQKPKVLLNRGTTGSLAAMFSDGASNLNMKNMTFEGIEFNGANQWEGDGGVIGQPYFIIYRNSVGEPKLTIKDCYFHNFTNGNIVRFSGAVGKCMPVDIQNSTFKNNNANLLHYVPSSVGDILLKNNTFTDNLADTALVYFASTTAKGTKFEMDHCTVNNYSGLVNSSLLKFVEFTGNVTIKNSIFTNVAGGFDFATPAPTIDYCYLDGFATTPTGTITNSFSGTSPAYSDPSAINYGLTNKSSFICGDGLPAGNTMYYVEVPNVQQATSINVTGFTANWLSVTDAVGYEVLLYQGETLVSANFVAAPTLNYTFTELTTGVSYTYKVKAMNSSGFYSLSSDGASATPSLLSGITRLDVQEPVRVAGSILMLTEPGKIEVYDLQGRTLIQEDVKSTIETGLRSGVYLLRLTATDGTQHNQKIFIR